MMTLKAGIPFREKIRATCLHNNAHMRCLPRDIDCSERSIQVTFRPTSPAFQSKTLVFVPSLISLIGHQFAKTLKGERERGRKRISVGGIPNSKEVCICKVDINDHLFFAQALWQSTKLHFQSTKAAYFQRTKAYLFNVQKHTFTVQNYTLKVLEST